MCARRSIHDLFESRHFDREIIVLRLVFPTMTPNPSPQNANLFHQVPRN